MALAGGAGRESAPLCALEAPTLLALPAPVRVAPRGRGRGAGGRGACGVVGPAQARQKAGLLAWIAHLQYLHGACSSPVLQALTLSLFGRGDHRPSVRELLGRFNVSVVRERRAGTPLLRACHAASTRRGHPTDLAVCFVALCRALAIPSRLVVAFDTTAPSKADVDAALRAAGIGGDATVAEGAAEEVLEGPMAEELRRLTAMGFPRARAVAALLEGEDAGAERFERAVALLLEAPEAARQGAPVGGAGGCPGCGSRPKGAFCGECGRRVRPGGAAGAADQEAPEDREAEPVMAWPEVFDDASAAWVAVDLIFDFVAKDPVVEWIHRGTPMLWVCAADDALQSDSDSAYALEDVACKRVGDCVLRDVTPRYSPSWWRVELARGAKALQRWWDDALRALGGSAPSGAAQRLAAEADAIDREALRSKRLAAGVPTTKAALKGNATYALETDLRAWEALVPWAKSCALVGGARVFLRRDIARVRSAPQWLKMRREVRPSEAPCKRAKLPKAQEECDLFGEWQTEAVAPLTRKRKQRAAPDAALAFPALPAPPKARRRAFARRRLRRKDPDVALSFPALPAPPKERKRRAGAAKPRGMPGFERLFQRLAAWLERRGCMPWDRSSDAEERRCAAVAARLRGRYAAGGLSATQAERLEALDGWSWGDAAGGAGRSDRPAASEAADDSTQQWFQLTVQRLATDLARQQDADERRAKLRQWQRAYHPDKNPGRASEVLPIFRWVQSRWDEEFRSADPRPSAATSQGAGAAPPRPPASPAAASDAAESRRALPQAARRRLMRKTACGA